MQNNNIAFEVQKTLDTECVKDILTTAIEGGIGYWAMLDNDTPDWNKAREFCKKQLNTIPCYCDVAYWLLITGKEIRFIDAEAEDEDNPEPDEVWYLTLDKFINGCKLWEAHSGRNLSYAVSEGDFDAGDADCLIQYALFNEVVFG